MTSTAASAEVTDADCPVKPGVSIKSVTDATFEADVLKAAGPVVVYVKSAKTANVHFDSVVGNVVKIVGSKAKVVKLDVDKQAATAKKFNLTATPALAVFNGGKLVEVKKASAGALAINAWITTKVLALAKTGAAVKADADVAVNAGKPVNQPVTK